MTLPIDVAKRPKDWRPRRVHLVLYRTAVAHEISMYEMIYGPKTAVNVLARNRAIVELSGMGFSMVQIGKYMGAKDRTTILYHLKKHRKRMASELDVVPDLSGEWAI